MERKENDMKKIIIVVKEGFVQEVLSDEDMCVTVIDFDSVDRKEEEIKELTDFVDQEKKRLKSVY